MTYAFALGLLATCFFSGWGLGYQLRMVADSINAM